VVRGYVPAGQALPSPTFGPVLRPLKIPFDASTDIRLAQLENHKGSTGSSVKSLAQHLS
jgi:ribosomal protein L11